MTAFVRFLANPALERITERGLLGGYYVRLGPLHLNLADWLSQLGGALGYGLCGHSRLLGKLLGLGASGAEAIAGWHDRAVRLLSEAESNERDFLELFVVPRMRRLGIEITSVYFEKGSPTGKQLKAKVKSQEVFQVAMNAFIDGAAIGHHFPDVFREYWEHHYELQPEREWQEARAHGVELREVQQERPLDEAVAELAAAAAEWARAEAPGLLADDELDVLSEFAGR